MDLVQRAKNIIVTPKTEWTVVEGETTPQGEVITSYVIPLAAVGAIAGFVGQAFVGVSVPFMGTVRVPIVAGLLAAVVGLALQVALVFVLAAVVNALAPTFGAQKNSPQAFKIAAYSITPAWVAGILNILPALGVLGIIAAIYGIYLLYLGLPPLMKSPPDKTVGYTLVVAIVCLVVMIVLGTITAAIVGVGGLAAGGYGGPAATQAQADPNSPLGALQQLGQKLDESAKKVESAEKSGDTAGQMAAAMEGLGALLGGGRRVDPIEVDQLKTFVPETFAGMPRTSQRAERNGVAGLMVATAEARYGDDQRQLDLEIVDTGGVSGLLGLASWVGVIGEKEDDSSIERTHRVDGRIVHEKQSKRGGLNEFGVVLGNRFIVTAKSSSLAVNDLKASVMTLDLSKLESLQRVGTK